MTTKAEHNRKMMSEGPQRGNGSELMHLLSCYITTVFDNDRDFLHHFMGEQHADDELLECYMASERTRINVMLECGQQITTTVRTDDLVEWCEAR